MFFHYILDPYNQAPSKGSPLYGLYCNVLFQLAGNEKGSGLAKKQAKGDIYAAKLNQGARAVFARYIYNDLPSLVLLRIFSSAEHDQYEQFLPVAHLRLRERVGQEGLHSPEKIVALSDLFKKEIAAVPAMAAPEWDTYYQYGEHCFPLSDEQQKALNVKLDALFLGYAGAGKTVVAVRLLQKMAEEASETDAPILYLGPVQLVKELTEQWKSVMLPAAQKARVKFLTLENLIKKLMPVEFVKDIRLWFLTKEAHLKKELNPWLPTKHRKNTEKELNGLERLLYQEFKLIVTFDTVEEYKQSRFSFFDSDKVNKDFILGVLKNYQSQLQGKINTDISCDALPGFTQLYSYLVIDEVQLLSVPVLKWIAKSKIRAALFGDPEQATVDAALNGLRLSGTLFSGITEYRLHGSYRVPQAVAVCVNSVLKAKRDWVSHKVAGVEEFISHKKETGTCQWISNCLLLLPPQIAVRNRDADTALVVFCEEDKKFFTDKGFSTFFPDEIQGLELGTIVICHPEIGLEVLLESQPDAMMVSAKEKSAIYEHFDKVLALNGIFVALTRATQNVIFLSKVNSKQERKLKKILGMAASAAGVALPTPQISSKDEWKKRMDQFILNNNIEQARNIWVLHLQHPHSGFEAHCRKSQPVIIPLSDPTQQKMGKVPAIAAAAASIPAKKGAQSASLSIPPNEVSNHSEKCSIMRLYVINEGGIEFKCVKNKHTYYYVFDQSKENIKDKRLLLTKEKAADLFFQTFMREDIAKNLEWRGRRKTAMECILSRELDIIKLLHGLIVRVINTGDLAQAYNAILMLGDVISSPEISKITLEETLLARLLTLFCSPTYVEPANIMYIFAQLIVKHPEAIVLFLKGYKNVLPLFINLLRSENILIANNVAVFLHAFINTDLNCVDKMIEKTPILPFLVNLLRFKSVETLHLLDPVLELLITLVKTKLSCRKTLVQLQVIPCLDRILEESYLSKQKNDTFLLNSIVLLDLLIKMNKECAQEILKTEKIWLRIPAIFIFSKDIKLRNAAGLCLIALISLHPPCAAKVTSSEIFPTLAKLLTSQDLVKCDLVLTLLIALIKCNEVCAEKLLETPGLIIDLQKIKPSNADRGVYKKADFILRELNAIKELQAIEW